MSKKINNNDNISFQEFQVSEINELIEQLADLENEVDLKTRFIVKLCEEIQFLRKEVISFEEYISGTKPFRWSCKQITER